MEWFFGHYAGPRHRRRRPAVPARSPTTWPGCPRPSWSPPSTTRCATRARPTPPRCAAAGVRVEARRFDGMIHGFFDMGPASAAARDAVTETCALFGKVLHA